MNTHLKSFIIVLSVTALYFVCWNAIIVFNLLPTNFSLSPPETSDNIGFGENTEILVYRYGFVPIYWSRLGGDLTLWHTLFLVALTFVFAGFELRSLART